MARSFKVLAVGKQQYPATYNFRDDDNGDFPSGWTDEDGAGCATTIIASLDGHKKVVQMYDNDAVGYCRMALTITSATTLTVEFWFRLTVLNAFYFNIDDGVNVNTFRLDNLAGVVINTWYHMKYYIDTTADTYSNWKNSIAIDAGVGLDNVMGGITRIRFNTSGGASVYYAYIDAVGLSADANYNIGDNCFWRHYKESEADTFEEDDSRTQGTSITWVDTVDTAASVEIIEEFTEHEHKKILRQDYTSAVGGYDYSEHDFATQAKDGWFSCYLKVADVTSVVHYALYEDAVPITNLRITASQFQKYSGGAWSQVAGSPTPVNNTWYLVYWEWTDAATDTIDCWIDNVLYETYNARSNQTSGINKVNIRSYGSGDYAYMDAPMSSLDGDERGDNRIFAYNATYTSEDITTDVINVKYSNSIYKWREATMSSRVAYENSEIFLQIYDVNSALAMEAEIKNRAQIREIKNYSLRDKNWDDLNNRSSNTFSADKIHDPTDATSILKTILPNVGEEDGDLLLVDADTKATTYSPTTKNYPDYEMLRDIADLADSCVIVHANGKVYLDDDKASGTTLDKDTAAHADMMTAPPLITDILETINYFEIFGAINPDTGTRFTKVIDNSGSDKKRKWRYTNNEFRTQTDVDNYATALSNRITTIKIIKFTAQSLGAHNMGETINYKFVDALYNVPQANYYVIFEEIDFDKNLNTIILSQGMIEDSKYSAVYERPENYNDSYASEIYETDLIPLVIPAWALLGATQSQWKVGVANTQGVLYNFTTDAKLDISREIVIKVPFKRTDAGADTVDINVYLDYWELDGSDKVFVWDAVADTLPAVALNKFGAKEFTIPAGTLPANASVDLYFVIQEAGKTITAHPISYRFYQKRSV